MCRTIATPPDDVASQLEQLIEAPTREESLVAVVEGRLDELCAQLDDAFDEMAARIDRVELRVAAVRQNLDDVLAVAREAAGTARQAAVAAEGRSASGSRTELADVIAQVGQVAQALRKEVSDGRSTLEASVARLAERLAEAQTRPVEIDTRELEEVASRSALHNAADIASLRHNVDSVAEAVRQQERWVGEMRTTLDWIKERLLLR